MMSEHEETAVRNPPVGADGEQPLYNETNRSIAEGSTKSNDDFWDPGYLPTFTMTELYDQVFLSRPPIIGGLLYAGTYLLAGASKIGKSFLSLQIAYHVSTGLPLWELEVQRGTVLYLALEDDYGRIQKRLYNMFGTENSDMLYLSCFSKQLGTGLKDQIESFVRNHSDTALIIIDTLQKIRDGDSDHYNYAEDYKVIGELKRLSDKHRICILVVHHTRKQPAGDCFEMISGTNGLMGCADGAFILSKAVRTDIHATLDVTGRDVANQRYHLIQNETTLAWELERAERELWKLPPDPILQATAALLQEQPRWSGTATELASLLGLDMQPNALTRHLNVNASRLMNESHIHYQSKREHAGRRIIFTYQPPEA